MKESFHAGMDGEVVISNAGGIAASRRQKID
jgi:hypothetical protein